MTAAAAIQTIPEAPAPAPSATIVDPRDRGGFLAHLLDQKPPAEPTPPARSTTRPLRPTPLTDRSVGVKPPPEAKSQRQAALPLPAAHPPIPPPKPEIEPSSISVGTLIRTPDTDAKPAAASAPKPAESQSADPASTDTPRDVALWDVPDVPANPPAGANPTIAASAQVASPPSAARGQAAPPAAIQALPTAEIRGVPDPLTRYDPIPAFGPTTPSPPAAPTLSARIAALVGDAAPRSSPPTAAALAGSSSPKVQAVSFTGRAVTSEPVAAPLTTSVGSDPGSGSAAQQDDPQNPPSDAANQPIPADVGTTSSPSATEAAFVTPAEAAPAETWVSPPAIPTPEKVVDPLAELGAVVAAPPKPAAASQSPEVSPTGMGQTSGNPVPSAVVATADAEPSRAPPPQLPVTQVALAITRGLAADGSGTFNLQLHPEQLGMVNVRLDIDAKGRASATITADRPETLALLRQDAPQLLTALNQAGISADPGSLNFAMREGGSGNPGGGKPDRESAAARNGASSTEPLAPVADTQTANPTIGRRLYDIRA